MATTIDPIQSASLVPVDPPLQDDTDDTLQQDLGEWNELLDQDLQNVLLKLAEKYCDEYKYPRRLEVMRAWQARSYWREMQHLNWNWENECWDVLGPAGYRSGSQVSKNDSAVLYTTNMYQGFGDSFIAIITQAVPSLRFEPEDADDPADIETARHAEPLRKLIQHENDPIKLMTKAAYYGWTDGRLHGWTRWAQDKRTKQSREMQTIYGVLEVKVPVIYDEQCDYPYLQLSQEMHLSSARAKVKDRQFPPDYWKKLKAGASGTGQSAYERIARISVKQGIAMKSAGGDAYGNLVTEQCTWMRPECFMDDSVDDKYRDQLEGMFPNGCWLEAINGVYTGSKDSNMDNQWVVENIMEGDGSFRNAKGTCLVSVQERANDIINVTQDIYEKTQPASHWNDKLWDVEARNQQGSMPGASYGVNMDDLPAGSSLDSQVFFEPAAHVSPDMLAFLKELFTDIPEFLTGISAILFGSDTGGDKSGKALQVQQNAAMGRIGLPFRVLKRFYARMMEQAVRCAVDNREKDVTLSTPDNDGNTESLVVAVSGLTGNIKCSPASDENFPESWISKRNTYMQLLQEGNNDPVMHAILTNPKNQMLAKRMIGLTDLEIPDADSWDKQRVEINLMLTEPFNPGGPEAVPNPMQPETIEVVNVPPSSSIPIDPDYDNNEAEFLTVTLWVNSPKGQKAKKENPTGFKNVQLHGLAHKQVLVQQAQQQMMQEAAMKSKPAPPPNEASHKNPDKKAEQKDEQGQQGPPSL